MLVSVRGLQSNYLMVNDVDKKRQSLPHPKYIIEKSISFCCGKYSDLAKVHIGTWINSIIIISGSKYISGSIMLCWSLLQHLASIAVITPHYWYYWLLFCRHPKSLNLIINAKKFRIFFIGFCPTIMIIGELLCLEYQSIRLEIFQKKKKMFTVLSLKF